MYIYIYAIHGTSISWRYWFLVETERRISRNSGKEEGKWKMEKVEMKRRSRIEQEQ